MYQTVFVGFIAVMSLTTASYVREFGQADDVPPLDSSLEFSWTEYKLSFNKSYNSADEIYRFVIKEFIIS